MDYAEVVVEVKRLSQAEKIALLKVLADSLNEGSQPKAERKHTLKTLYGALRPADGRIPTDEEIKEEYIQHLVEKYQ